MKFATLVFVILCIVIAGCDEKPTEPQTFQNPPTNENIEPSGISENNNQLDMLIEELESQFFQAQQHGGEISPQEYTKIESQLKSLEGIENERVRNLRTQFFNLKVGGSKTRSMGCSGKGPVTFTHPPMQIDKIETISPLGQMIGGHVTPIDHGYYSAKTWEPGKRNDVSKFVDVFAPAAGVITSVRSMPSEFASSDIGDYYIVLQYTCTFYSIFIHVNQLSEKLVAIKDSGDTVKVEAGEIIGRAPAFDFSVHNEEVVLPGFIVPEHYEIEPAKIHTVSMFDHFSEPIRSQLLGKNIRQKEPRSGKIDYDRDGRLVGNWFEENTNGYRGKEEYQRSIGYWATHLAFAYDGLDPDLIIVSMGDYGGEAVQFAIKGNIPDPKDVTVATGLVKYELVNWQYVTDSGQEWDRLHFAKITGSKRYDNQVDGVVLVQMLEDRKMKFEAFPGKKASQISMFTTNAKMYER